MSLYRPNSDTQQRHSRSLPFFFLAPEWYDPVRAESAVSLYGLCPRQCENGDAASLRSDDQDAELGDLGAHVEALEVAEEGVGFGDVLGLRSTEECTRVGQGGRPEEEVVVCGAEQQEGTFVGFCGI